MVVGSGREWWNERQTLPRAVVGGVSRGDSLPPSLPPVWHFVPSSSFFSVRLSSFKPVQTSVSLQFFANSFLSPSSRCHYLWPLHGRELAKLPSRTESAMNYESNRCTKEHILPAVGWVLNLKSNPTVSGIYTSAVLLYFATKITTASLFSRPPTRLSWLSISCCCKQIH